MQSIGIDSLFFRTMPSHRAVTEVFWCPISMTSALAFPCEYLAQY